MFCSIFIEKFRKQLNKTIFLGISYHFTYLFFNNIFNNIRYDFNFLFVGQNQIYCK